MNKELIDDVWLNHYYYAKRFYNEHSHLLIPIDYNTFTEEEKVICLGYWIATQRRLYDKNKP